MTTPITLTRNLQAITIPQGTTHTLPKGTQTHITQQLGGTITIHANGNLYRIEGKDADALGQTPTPQPTTQQTNPNKPIPPLNDQTIWQQLRTCYDPEIPLNIVDLGLIYHLHNQKLPNGKHHIHIKMTLTAPGCNMGETIANDARQKLLTHPAIQDTTIEIVWDPPWHQSMITPQGRQTLGL